MMDMSLITRDDIVAVVVVAEAAVVLAIAVLMVVCTGCARKEMSWNKVFGFLLAELNGLCGAKWPPFGSIMIMRPRTVCLEGEIFERIHMMIHVC